MRITIPLFTLMRIRIRNRIRLFTWLLHLLRASMALLGYILGLRSSLIFTSHLMRIRILQSTSIQIRIRSQLFILMRIRIRHTKMMRIRIRNTGRYIECVLPWHCWLALPVHWWNSKGTNQRFKSCSYGWGITWMHTTGMFPKGWSLLLYCEMKKSHKYT
jgi:hypothetical protein